MLFGDIISAITGGGVRFILSAGSTSQLGSFLWLRRIAFDFAMNKNLKFATISLQKVGV